MGRRSLRRSVDQRLGGNAPWRPAYRRLVVGFEEISPPLVLVLAVVLGLGIRLYYVLSSDFPLNDGGLFYAMARDIQHAQYSLPSYTSYNTESIPFAYPPLFVYVLALLDDITPLSPFDILRFLPLILSVATILAFYVLAKAMLPWRAGVAASVIVFATIQNGFEWHIMGGGVTRAPALLFSLVAIYHAYQLYKIGGRTHLAAAAVFAGLAVLTHPDLFVAVGIGLLFLVYGRSRRGVRDTILIAIGVAAMTAPWWGSVIARHGADVLLATGESRTQQGWTDSILPWRDFLTLPFTKQPLLNWPGVVAVLGAGAAIATGQFFLPLWLVAEVLAEPHQAPNFIHVPVALLIGFAVGGVIAPAWRGFSAEPPRDAGTSGAETATPPRAPREHRSHLWLGASLLVGYALTVGLFSAFNEPGQLDHMRGLDRDRRELFGWIDTNTPPGSPFLIVSGLPWWGDRISEWFPALTRGHSLFTAQGSEWLGDAFTQRIAGHDALQGCGQKAVECLDQVARAHDVRFRYVYVDSACCASLADSLRHSAGYQVIYESRAGILASHPVDEGQ